MHEGNHMGIMTTLKKPTLERGPSLHHPPHSSGCLRDSGGIAVLWRADDAIEPL
jgi:hypothetical protein